jgi:hypothetical protein
MVPVVPIRRGPSISTTPCTSGSFGSMLRAGTNETSSNAWALDGHASEKRGACLALVKP